MIAISLDPETADSQRILAVDGSVYRTGLDLSKPVPPGWSLSELGRPTHVSAVGLLAVVLLGLGAAKATGHGGTTLATTWLAPMAARLGSMRLLRRPRDPVWAVVATIATFVAAYVRHEHALTEVVAYALGLIVLSLLCVAARLLVARRVGTTTVHRSWPPALLFGLVAGAAGLPVAPLPVVRSPGTERQRIKVHLAAPVAMATVSAGLFVESALWHTPLTASWAVAALVMSASMLLPVGPLDGARIGKGAALAAGGMVGGALLLLLGLVT